MRISASPWKIASVTLFVVWLALILHTFGDYGMSWDEQYRNKEGAKKLEYYQNLFSGNWKKYDSPEDNYPGFYDLILQSVNLLQPCGPGTLGLIYTDHLLTSLAALLTVVAAYQIGRRLGGGGENGERVAFFSALFLTAFPHFYGHAFINPKDIPFACAYLWSLYYTLKLIDAPLTIGLILKATIAYGLTLGVRLGGLFLFGFMALAFLLRTFLLRKLPPAWWMKLLQYIGISAAVLVGAILLLLPWWPFSHTDPLGILYKAIFRVASYPWNGPVLLNGHVYPATDLPWYYLPEMLLITTPEFLIFLGLLGAGFLFSSLIRKTKTEKLDYFTPRRLGIFLLAFSFFFPITVVILKNSTLYDGIRHFLFVLGPWAILAALTLEKVIVWIKKNMAQFTSPILKLGPAGIYAIIAFPVAAVFVENTQLHPYQYTYFNLFAGKLEKACQNFDTEYWGTSHREAVELLAKHLARRGDKKVYKVTSPMAPWLVENFLPSNMVYTTDGRQADFFISFLRINAHMWSDGDIMEDCIVERKGVPFAIVRDRRKIIKAEAEAMKKGQTSNHRLISGALDIIDSIPIF